MDFCLHWQPAIAVIIVHLFNLFSWSMNSLSLYASMLFIVSVFGRINMTYVNVIT